MFLVHFKHCVLAEQTHGAHRQDSAKAADDQIHFDPNECLQTHQGRTIREGKHIEWKSNDQNNDNCCGTHLSS